LAATVHDRDSDGHEAAIVTETLENRKARILTVDDDRITLAMLAITIRKAGYDIVQASSAEEALDAIAENQPDLAVLDISMPGMSGIELAQRLREETRIPFMFLSTHAEPDIVREATGQGAIGYLVKPIDFTHVVSVIEAGLAHTQALLQLHDGATRLEEKRASGTQKQADLIGRYAELTELEIRLQHAHGRPLRPVFDVIGATCNAHAEIKTLEGHIESLCHILDAYRDTNASTELDAQARADLGEIGSKLVLGLLRRDTAALIDEYREANRRVCSIVRGLKEVSLADGSNQWQHADLHAILDTSLKNARSRIDAMGAVRKEYGELPPIECLPAHLGEVFLNLLVNAAQATGDREQAMIGVRTGIADERIWIEISDNGCGILPENRELIFHPFFTTRPTGTGLGLGLSMCRDIICKHAGDIEITSKSGEGSSFRVSLPRRRTAL
jgi:two-component system NtrC family sensor kinase